MSITEMKLKFCSRVYELRSESDLTVPELARRSGLSLAMVEALDRREVPKSMMVGDAFRLAAVFGCAASELFR